MNKYFGGEGGDDLLTLTPGGGRLDGSSFPFKLDGDGGGIVLGLLRHEEGQIVEENENERATSWVPKVLFCVLGLSIASCVIYMGLCNETQAGARELSNFLAIPYSMWS